MIVDTSALLAILWDEPGAEAYARAMWSAQRRRISAGNLLEAGIVLDSRGDPITGERLNEFLASAGIEVDPVTEEQVRIGREAYRTFGKTRGHPARLNYGDCFAYALAKQTGEPLLFKGNDFSQTDLRSALDAN